MIVARIVGGLGNQLFQYSYAASLSKKYPIFVNRLRKMMSMAVKLHNIVSDVNDTYFNATKLASEFSYISGYWQNPRCWQDYSDEIRAELHFKPSKYSAVMNYIKKIESLENSCSIHFRRGDYISSPCVYSNIYGICDLEYYKLAIEYIEKETKKSVNLVFFSDDIENIKGELNSLKRPSLFVNLGKGIKDSEE